MGRCKTFDASADGYGRGEGCVAVVLKPRGSTEGSPPGALAVLRSTATNQDGRSSSLTAPNGPAQSALIRTAVTRAGAGSNLALGLFFFFFVDHTFVSMQAILPSLYRLARPRSYICKHTSNSSRSMKISTAFIRTGAGSNATTGGCMIFL